MNKSLEILLEILAVALALSFASLLAYRLIFPPTDYSVVAFFLPLFFGASTTSSVGS